MSHVKACAAGHSFDERKMISEDAEPIALSALQHWAYCPRQCGLIHLEQAFDDNLHTLRGQAVHRQVDDPGMEERKGLRVERALPIWHDVLCLIGKADVVEFEPDGTPYPIEYKHGSRNKAVDIAACDDVQLAAQALCLEAMTGRAVSEGALYYASSKRRRIVTIDRPLRAQVAEFAQAVGAMLRSGNLPPPTTDMRRCKSCSLHDRCQPEALRELQTGQAAACLFNPDA